MTDTPRERAPRVRQQALIWTVGMAVTLVMLGLGLWQMSVFRSQGQDALRARLALPPVPLTQAVPDNAIPRDAYGRQLSVEGAYRPGRDLLIPDQADPTRCRVLTPFDLTDGRTLPVVRGVSSPCASAPPAPDGPRSMVGVFLPSEADVASATQPLGSVRLARLAQVWEGTITPGFLTVGPETAAASGLRAAEVALPSASGQARNNGYALQWWIFAAATVAATVKLSRDAAGQKGFMAPKSRPVDKPVED